jgi:hypothetical protein
MIAYRSFTGNPDTSSEQAKKLALSAMIEAKKQAALVCYYVFYMYMYIFVFVDAM